MRFLLIFDNYLKAMGPQTLPKYQPALTPNRDYYSYYYYHYYYYSYYYYSYYYNPISARSKAIAPQVLRLRAGVSTRRSAKADAAADPRARARGILSRTAGVSAPQACDQCPALVAQQSCAKESPRWKLCAL